MRILGVDPGTVAMGYGLIESDDTGTNFIDCGVIIARKKSPTGERLAFLYERLAEVISHYRPDVAAIEQPFVARNVRSAIAIGQAQAIAILAASNRGIPVHEYTPAEIKQAVSSYGASSKEQVQEMVRLHLGLAEAPQPDDAADALAAALCHHSRMHLASLLARQK
ncbi:MAG: crossover junction endodeoxyribonuclease RuvC [Chloroflexi bacterium]|nr:crossover junction endodeoxyribonuclease RuvC [Chloroflexota bacterium]